MFRFFQQFNYTDVVFFIDANDEFYGPMGDVIEVTMKNEMREFLYTTKFQDFNGSKDGDEVYRKLLINAHQISRVIEKSKRNYNYTYPIGASQALSPVVTHVYDAFVLYANLVSDLITQGKDYRDGEAVGSLAANYSFYSPLNGNVQLDSNADRVMSFVLKTMSSSTAGKYQAAIEFDSDGNMKLLGAPMSLPGQIGMPPNVPECGFKHNMCKVKVRVITKGEIAGAIIGSLLICGTIAAAGRYSRKKLQNTLADPFLVEDLCGRSLHARKERRIRETEDGDEITVQEESDDRHHTAQTAMTLAFYNGATVSLQETARTEATSYPDIVEEAASIRRLQHANLQKVIGIAINDDNLCDFIVGEACQKGSLTDLLLNDANRLDWPFRHSLIKDFIAGMVYLHSTPIVSTGWLTSHSCLIDSRLVGRLSDYAFTLFRRDEDLEPPNPERTDRDFELLLWRAPELLRRFMPERGSQKGDVYSFGILLQQFFVRSLPYRTTTHKVQVGEKFKAMEIAIEVKNGAIPPLRPRVPVSAVSNELYELMESCWEENPLDRPIFLRIRTLFRAIVGNSGDNIVEQLIASLDKQATELELKVEAQTKIYLEEKARSTNMILQLLPKGIGVALIRGEALIPEIYRGVTVQSSDISNFSVSTKDLSPTEIVNIITQIHATVDTILESSTEVICIESFLDDFLTVSGLPVPNGTRHAFELCLAALAFRKEIGRIVFGPANELRKLRLRSGIHTGPCVAAVIGVKLPKYCIFGETVYVARQLKFAGEGSKILVSDTTTNLLEAIGGFPMEERGLTKIKGREDRMAYWLVGSAI
ncbi:Atrial natriuretic peptide receptor 1 [Hypsibius exemplaris]|uniref:guanylate cyclase n=1 Tax=Hypsibius exemplaris TaxID=2072580 RepID=A0A1W0WNI1_HYPEX|nr:Atrial natriuretic peptide receptor 1 [Hypsibius exemplaris]